MDWENPADFGLWFYTSFVDPLLNICKNTTVLGVSLFTWILGLGVLALGVRFVRSFFGADDGKE